MAISNKHSTIKGCPILSEDDAKMVMKALLAIRGINQKKQKEAWERGELRLQARPMAYKGTAHAWLRNLGNLEQKADWTKESAIPDGPEVPKIPLKTIVCPSCHAEQSTEKHQLRVKIRFPQLTCQRCRQVTSTIAWKCACGMRWFKCDRHVHKKLLNKRGRRSKL